jgi:hypothetical protein
MQIATWNVNSLRVRLPHVLWSPRRRRAFRASLARGLRHSLRLFGAVTGVELGA